MIKHQCRFCSHLVTGNGIYCCAHRRTYSEGYTKRRNDCAEFEFNPMDAYFERDWVRDKAKPTVVETLKLKGVE